MLGQCVKGVAADCIRFVCGWVNAMYREERTHIPRLPSDTAMHNRDGAMRSLRMVLSLYPNHREVIAEGWLEPGDIVMTAKPGCGPGHSMIVSARKNVLWHCTGLGVQTAGIGVLFGAQPEFRPFRVYRLLDKHLWV